MFRENVLGELIAKVEYGGTGGNNVTKKEKNKQDSCILSKIEFAKHHSHNSNT